MLKLTVNTPPEASRPCLIQWSHSLKWVSTVEQNHRNHTVFQKLLRLTVFCHMFVSTQGLILTLCQFMPKDHREWLSLPVSRNFYSIFKCRHGQNGINGIKKDCHRFTTRLWTFFVVFLQLQLRWQTLLSHPKPWLLDKNVYTRHTSPAISQNSRILTPTSRHQWVTVFFRPPLVSIKNTSIKVIMLFFPKCVFQYSKLCTICTIKLQYLHIDTEDIKYETT